MTQTIVYILICINVVTFVVYGIDKWKAKHSKMRIREAALLMLAVLGGSIGALLGVPSLCRSGRFPLRKKQPLR